MITTNQAIQKAKAFCDTYNKKYDETIPTTKLEGHMYTVELSFDGVSIFILVDKETGGIINDIIF